jgi:regulator of sigma E protease
MSILAAFLSIFILIILHELGHFVLAKKFGVRVEEFGIGIPPRLKGIKIGETLYSVNLLPIGAFVKLQGEQSSDTAPGSFGSISIWKRMMIVLGGVVSSWLVAIIIFTLLAGTVGLPIGEASPPHEAPVQGILFTGKLTAQILGMFANIITGNMPVSADDFMGPVGVINVLQDSLLYGIAPFFFLLGVIAIFLAIFNTLPIPALDGGRFMFLAIEAVTRKPVPDKVAQVLIMSSFAVLIPLILFVTVRDVARIF